MRKQLFLGLGVVLAVSPAAAQFVAPGGTVPAASGSVNGENGTVWRSDVSVLNLNSSPTSVVFVLYPEIRSNGPVFEVQQSDPIPIDGNAQLTIPSILTSLFDERGKNGSISVFSTDGSPVVVASRTYTPGPAGGSFGLNVYGVLAAETAWIANVEHDGFFRTNIGIFSPIDPAEGQSLVFVVTVRDADGVEVGSGSLIFEEAGLKQKNLDFFGVDDALLDGWIEISCGDPTAIWYAYATVIDNVTGDSVYRAAISQQSSIP